MKRSVSTLCVIVSLLVGSWVFLGGLFESPAIRGESRAREQSSNFAEYWYSGTAEIARYELKQARYGEIHQGDAVLITVTEDFLPKEQVKADESDRRKTGAWPILKVNFTRNFNTGIYPYSMMTSVFTPIDHAAHPRSLKTTTSVQEWCGQTFLQLNLRDAGYQVRGYSYFESEGDREFTLPSTWIEDEIWTRIRIAPDSLPVGDVKMIPGGQQHRLRHTQLTAARAQASFGAEKDGVREYLIEYPEERRTLKIRFQTLSPHVIEGWEETYSDFGKVQTTTARRTHLIRSDYWNRHGVNDTPLRKKLGL
jgi:hypothetical protein